MKKGFSLIYLSVVIVVIIILASITIVPLTKSQNSLINSTSKTVFKSDIIELRDELEYNISNMELKKTSFNRENLNLITLNEIRTYIPSFPEKYEGNFKVKKGNLVFCGNEEKDKEVVEELAFMEIEE